uniref:Secreted protein n=1 Tax=Steinernema glaseri TaxID=37863 RepID=A0A1I8AXG6_9BILA
MLIAFILLSLTAGSPLRRSKGPSTEMVTTPSGDTSTTAIYCAPFCDDVDFSALVFPDYADVVPETGSDVGNEYH